MTWLLFMDESGHDHRSMPYEVRGGLAIHTAKLWRFTNHIRELEIQYFDQPRHEFGSEIKGDILLKKSRFKAAEKYSSSDKAEQYELTRNFLKGTQQKKPPRNGEREAYAKSCLDFAEDVVKSLDQFGCFVFASFIPAKKPPKNAPLSEDLLRKDHVFLLERYFYFLESKKERGLIVMDGTEKTSDRRFVKGLEKYFQQTKTGKQRARKIVPVPFFVESDMGYGVQVADLCIYCLNNAYRVSQIGLNGPVRTELCPFVDELRKRIWHRDIRKNGNKHHIFSVVYIPDPYQPRNGNG